MVMLEANADTGISIITTLQLQQARWYQDVSHHIRLFSLAKSPWHCEAVSCAFFIVLSLNSIVISCFY